MPGNNGVGHCSLRIRLLRSSSFTDRLEMRSSENALLRRAPRVRGKSQVALVNCRPPLHDCTRRTPSVDEALATITKDVRYQRCQATLAFQCADAPATPA